eukprot:478660-Rhodomonas_salina.2
MRTSTRPCTVSQDRRAISKLSTAQCQRLANNSSITTAEAYLASSRRIHPVRVYGGLQYSTLGIILRFGRYGREFVPGLTTSGHPCTTPDSAPYARVTSRSRYRHVVRVSLA